MKEITLIVIRSRPKKKAPPRPLRGQRAPWQWAYGPPNHLTHMGGAKTCSPKPCTGQIQRGLAGWQGLSEPPKGFACAEEGGGRVIGGSRGEGSHPPAGSYPIPSTQKNCWKLTCSAQGNGILSAANKSKSSFWANSGFPHRTNTQQTPENGRLLVGQPNHCDLFQLYSRTNRSSHCSIEIHAAGNEACGLAMPFTSYCHTLAQRCAQKKCVTCFLHVVRFLYLPSDESIFKRKIK